jgi:hypothetical protein
MSVHPSMTNAVVGERVAELVRLRRLRTGPSLAVAAVVAAIVVVLVASRGTGLEDGTYTVEIVSRDAIDRVIKVDEVSLLSGEEARAAAVEDGQLAAGEDLPNDYYLRDERERVVTLPVSARASLTVMDCTAGCAAVPADLTAFLSGAVQAFNGSAAVFQATVTGGHVTALDEVYLP